MKKHLILSTLFYLIFLGSALLAWHGFKNQEAIDFIPLALLLLGSLLLNSYLLHEKFLQENNILHATKEILHELNIPISTIQANTNLLKRSHKKEEKALRRLERIQEASKRLEHLYEELLYSIKKEIRSIKKESVSLEELIRKRVEAFKLLGRNSFELELKSATLFIDKIGFEKMVDNILMNAMKYSPKESKIKISFKDNILSIQDFGKGMTELELMFIYDRYYQSDNRTLGEGIGLSLVKNYCDTEGINMRISSKVEEGTVVHLDLREIILNL